MKLLVFFLSIKLISCAQYVIDVNEYHKPLTNFDIASKTVKYCIHINNETLDVNYLTGTWYTIYKLAKGRNGVSSEYCKTTNFTKPTKEDIDAYKAKYDLQNESFTFNDPSVLYSEPMGNTKAVKGIIVGGKTAKYYFLDPTSGMHLMGMYDILTYKAVNNDYMIYYDCKMRGHVKYIMSRKRNQTDEELENLIRPIYALERMGKKRFCCKSKVRSTTPYF